LFNCDIITHNKQNINSKIYNFKSELNDSCFQTENKIYWNNNKNLEIENLKEDIKNSKSISISYENKTHFYKRENPKISIIITVYNQGYYIKTSYAFIQKQEFKDIEIIFVDDSSSDNSSLIIKELIKFDKKIIYLKNSINKKQFYSINLGVLFSKGEYILSIDPDDLILNNILLKAYKTAKYYNLEIL
jgi:cellulose synthase/poly-beta-1,6-N-acetylglucosamine synthase-like glycosyltransferase